jgi:hypothetical protein
MNNIQKNLVSKILKASNIISNASRKGSANYIMMGIKEGTRRKWKLERILNKIYGK